MVAGIIAAGSCQFAPLAEVPQRSARDDDGGQVGSRGGRSGLRVRVCACCQARAASSLVPSRFGRAGRVSAGGPWANKAPWCGAIPEHAATRARVPSHVRRPLVWSVAGHCGYSDQDLRSAALFEV